MTQIIINIEDGKSTIGYVPTGVSTAVSKSETLAPSNAIMQGNLAKSIWEAIKDWKIDRGEGLSSATYPHVGLIIDAVVRAKEWDAVERQQILDKVNTK